MKCWPYLVLLGDHGVSCAGVSAKHVPGSGQGGYTQNWLSHFGAADPESQPCSPSVPTWIPYQTDFTPGISVLPHPKTFSRQDEPHPSMTVCTCPWEVHPCSHRGRGGRQNTRSRPSTPIPLLFIIFYSCSSWKKEHTARFLQSLRKHNLNVSYPSIIQGFDLRRNSQGPSITPIPLTLSGTRRLFPPPCCLLGNGSTSYPATFLCHNYRKL